MSTQPTVLAWAEIVEHCSRLHTARRRLSGPWEGAEPREDSHMLNVMIGQRAAQIVPTRMHEPGFYYRFNDAGGLPCRSDDDMALLRLMVEDGLVTLP